MVKILLITRGIYPLSIGGIEIHTYYLAKALSKKFKVSIIAQKTNNHCRNADFCKLIELINVPSVHSLSSLVFIIKGLYVCMNKIGKIDIVHAHQALTPAVLAFLISKLYHVPFIITCHGSEIRIQRSHLIRLIQYFLFKKAKYITVVSSEMKKILVKNYNVCASQVRVIPNGYDEQVIKLVNNKKIKDKKDDFKRIVFVASLRPFKDPLTLLEGFRKAVLKYPLIKLHIIGDGPLRRTLEIFCFENDITSKVVFEGNKPHTEVLEIIANADIFVLTSIEEGLPTVLIEAMSLGKPIISTNVGGVTEVIEDGVSGILIPPKSPQCLAEALKKLLIDQNLRRRLGQTATEMVKNYTWDKIAEKYESIYKELLPKKYP